jgi:hypothetical protein
VDNGGCIAHSRRPPQGVVAATGLAFIEEPEASPVLRYPTELRPCEGSGCQPRRHDDECPLPGCRPLASAIPCESPQEGEGLPGYLPTSRTRGTQAKDRWAVAHLLHGRQGDRKL